ncbi:MAG: quinol dehydrogenase ferredoxin subunit NapH [Proteobacteria bacterium]|nr:MAG: quinol dehydrogenase ferredoxin subunit NapH [Pseudomonadota bacterium]
MIRKYKFLILRRIVQIGMFVLFAGANIYGWNLLKGNLSSSLILDTIPLADPYAILQMFCAGGILGLDAMLGAFIVLLFYGLVGGRAFCSWVCPLNMVTDLANYLRRTLRLNVHKYLHLKRSFRYWILFLSLVVSFVLGYGAFEMISPIGILSRGLVFGFGFGIFVIIAIFLFDLFIHNHGWCGYVCPLGAFYSLVGQKSLIRVSYEHEKCTRCMKCKEICPEHNVLSIVTKKSGFIAGKECTNCGRCVEVCDDDALNFSFRKIGESNVKN